MLLAPPGEGGAEIAVLRNHAEIVLAEYEGYARNALVQLRRIREGTQIEEDHMRNRQMIVRWLMANTKAIEVRQRDGKTFYTMVETKLRDEVVARVKALDLPSYTAFVMPKLTAARDGSGAITDVTISYPMDLTAQMLEFSGAKR